MLQDKPFALLEASRRCDHQHTPVQKPSHALPLVKSLEFIPGIHPSQPAREQPPSHTNKGGAIPSTQGNTKITARGFALRGLSRF